MRHVRFEAQQHDHEEEEDDDGAGVDDDLQERDQVRIERDEHQGHLEERHHQGERAVHHVAVEDHGQRRGDREHGHDPEEDHVLVHPSSSSTRTADAATLARPTGNSFFQPNAMSWS